MRIWLFNPAGSIPGEGWREYRYSIIAETFANFGHEVVWWTSSYSHQTGAKRANSWQDIKISENYLIKIVPSGHYKKHVSLKRLFFYFRYSYNLFKKTREEDKVPDLIILVSPSLFSEIIAVNFKKRKNVKLIVDIMDLWPELFSIALPKSVRLFSKLLFMPFFSMRDYAIKNADGVTSLCQSYIKYFKERNTIPANSKTATIYNGINVKSFSNKMNNQDSSLEFLNGSPIKKKNEIWAIYAGTLGNNYDVNTLLEASVMLVNNHKNIRFLFTGQGPLEHDIVSICNLHGNERIHFLGKLGHEELIRIYRYCDIGLCPYKGGSTVSMPDKVYDYFAAGLAVINSLEGELKDILVSSNSGLHYQAGQTSSLVHRISFLVSNRSLLSAMKENSFNLAMTFDKEYQYKKFIALSNCL